MKAVFSPVPQLLMGEILELDLGNFQPGLGSWET